MIFNVSCDLEYALRFPSTLILNIHAQKNETQSVREEQFACEPALPFQEFMLEGSHSRFIRLQTGTAKSLKLHYSASVDVDYGTYQARSVAPTPVAELDQSSIPFLFPSRYCQSDGLSRLAWDLFGKIDNPHEKVVAISDWIYGNVDYVRGSTTSLTSAYDTVTQRTGVCRDFSHLGIALCRALNIPARYFSGYAYELQPADFHACFECLIAGNWVVFDATRLAHLNGLVRIGTGRDAAEAAVATIFGSARNTKTVVNCTLAPDQTFHPIDRAQLDTRGVTVAPSA